MKNILDRKWWGFIPLRSVNPKITGKYAGKTFLIWQWYSSEKNRNNEELVNHENFHVVQQIETGFVLGWLLYGFFYVRNRLRGLDHKEAYRKIPQEIEAYKYQKDPYSIDNRPFWNFWKYV